MPISYIYTGEPMEGNAEDNHFIAYKGSTGTDNNTVNAGAGDDLVIGDSSDTWIPNASYLNGSIGTAFNFETITSTWTTAENQMFGDSTIPHTTAIVEATIGQSEFFRVQIGAGQQITIDLDFASNTAIGTGRDLVVELQDSLGNIIATADDSLISNGGQGSFSSSPGSASSYDPFLTFTVASAGIYYINVRPFGGGPGSTFTENNTFVLNVMVTGHAVAANNPIQGADTLNGGDGNDALFGQGGADVINGDGGDDFIDSGTAGDIVHGGEGNDTIFGGDGTEENIHGDEGNDVLRSGGEGHYYGDAGNDIIYAGLTSGVNEVLDGGADVDTLDTTTWNGTYVVDLVAGTSDFGEIFLNFENVVTGNGADTITGSDAANDITTKGGSDTVNAGAGNDVVAGGADGDTLDGGLDHDVLNYRQSNGAVTINLATDSADGGHATGDTIAKFEGVWGSVLGDTLTGGADHNELRGFEGSDILDGGGGNDILDGGINDDTMTGGPGDDTYFVDSLGDVVNELPGEGTDTLAVGFKYVLANGSPLEWLATINPNATTAIDLTGNSGVNRITGNAGANVLNGAGGVDVLIGLGGDDWYIVDNAAEVINETVDNGNDRVFASLSFTLASGRHVETLSTTNSAGSGAINLTGNELDNALIGNAGNNTLDGGGGADTMSGLAGDDWYIVNSSVDVVNETSGNGTDRVFTSASYALGAGRHVETMSTSNNAGTGAIDLTGNELVNALIGNAGNNTLDGKGGGDTMSGLAGDDYYIVDDALDVINETAGNGTDRVFASISYALDAGRHIEMLTTTNSAADTEINLTGNEIVNSLVGNAGNNTLDGKVGADTLSGLGGDDYYIVDNAADTVVEVAGLGNDRVFASVTYALDVGMHVEMLTTTNSAATTAINLTGNEQANTLVGNAGANTLNGGLGIDSLSGLGGDDWYYVDHTSDVVIEAVGAGADRVFASVSYTLGAARHIETLSTTDSGGVGAINLTGNELVNSLVGNAGSNVLDGKDGSDTLNGLGGADTFRFSTALGGGNVDAVQGYNPADDLIQLDDAVFAGLALGALTAGAFNTGAAATQADDRIIYNSATGALLFDADGLGGAAGVQFATLSPGLAMAASEFFVI